MNRQYMMVMVLTTFF